MNTTINQEHKVAQVNPDEGSAKEYNHIINVVAVMSGKGGVGKSFVTSLLASALAQDGYQVGILDADITGPSIPMLFGLHGPVEPGTVGILPLQSHSGIKVISMNLLLSSEDQAVIWRGPLISKAIKQLWGDVMWGNLDYLLVDLPPGTSDATLTIMQSLPVKGIVMVTTPQGLATLIVRKAVHMAQSIGVQVVGVVENMAYFICPETSRRYLIFGPSHAEEVAETANAPMLAQLPMDPNVATLCDAGKVEDVYLKELPTLLEAFLKAAPIYTKANVIHELKPTIKKNTAEIPDRRQPQKTDPQFVSSKVVSNYIGAKSFSAKALKLIESQENIGSFENPDARGFVRGSCGDSMQIDLQLKGEIIQEARFITDGCGATIACGSMITQLAQTKTLIEAQQITPEDLLEALNGLPEGHEHCAKLAVQTLCEAITNAIENRGTKE